MLRFAAHIESFGRQLVNRWWRPAAVVGLVAGVWINGVVLPIETGKAADLGQLAALCAALAPLFAIRELGKRWGTAAK